MARSDHMALKDDIRAVLETAINDVAGEMGSPAPVW
jgi:hypothetical protein